MFIRRSFYAEQNDGPTIGAQLMSKTLYLTLAIAFFAAVPDANAQAVQAWCGNGCSTDNKGTTCTNWTAGAGSNQSCQAHALCSTECTTWPTSANATVNIQQLSVQSAKSLRGAKTFQMSKPPRK